jgi:uncharacterized protein (TIGR03083 family)
LLERIRQTHRPLEVLVAPLTEAQLTQPGVNGEWTIKDVLAHITWWERHMLRRLRTGQSDVYREGEDPRTSTDQANAQVFAANRDRPLAAVLADFDATYREVLSALEHRPEDELAREDTFMAIGSDTFTHYPDHTAAIQSWLAGETP